MSSNINMLSTVDHCTYKQTIFKNLDVVNYQSKGAALELYRATSFVRTSEWFGRCFDIGVLTARTCISEARIFRFPQQLVRGLVAFFHLLAVLVFRQPVARPSGDHRGVP